jgi:hypothetical protein
MRVAVVNRFYPPDNAITGVSAAELVAILAERLPQAEFRVFASAARYAGVVDSRNTGPARVERIATNGSHGGPLRRLGTSLVEGRALARRALSWADTVISLTDPPLLGYWIGREIGRQRRPVRWLEWTMDLYPEAFQAAGLVGEHNPAYRHVITSLRRHQPDAYLCLGEAQADAVKVWRRTVSPRFVLPCGIVNGAEAMASVPPAWRRNDDRVILAYAGNVGWAHCPELLEALVEAADPDQFLFVFALYGSHAERIKARLAHYRNIVWADHLSHAELAHADVHVASLLPEWTHVCVPSKAVSTVCLGRPLLFAGDPSGDTAGLLADAAWVIDTASDRRYDRAAIAGLLDRVADAGERTVRRRHALALAARLQREKALAFDLLTSWLQNADDFVSARAA